MTCRKSKLLYKKAIKINPGGVNSPVRAWKSVGGNPLFFEKGEGSKIFDVDGNSYIDYVMSYGPLMLGHAHPRITEAVREVLKYGTSFGSCNKLEVDMAETLCSAFSSIEKVRMVSSGTEAVMSAIRLARGFTGKSKVVKFDGCYHGHSDSMLVKAGSGLAGRPDSLGVPEAVAKDTISLPYNNLEAVESVLNKKTDIACVIVEPVCGNMGVVPPKDGFLEGLREATEKNDVLLIFDEVITGFKLCYGGAQDYFKVKSDLTCLGKIIGGGFPVGAFGGRKDIMDYLAPEGGVYQAGTLSGNPVALTAGLTTLNILKDKNVYSRLERITGSLLRGLNEIVEDHNVDVHVSGVESMLCVYFTPNEVTDYESAKTSDLSKYSLFFNKMLSRGVYLPPSQFESMFLSAAHSSEDMDFTLDAAEEVFSRFLY